MNNPPLLKVTDLQNHGLGPWSFALAAGECISLTGPSGSGKSSLLRALADLDPATGDVVLSGESRERVSPPVWRCRVGLLPAEPRWWRDTAREHAADWPTESLQALGCAERLLDTNIAQLSTGERQRLALLRMLARKPRVLLLDEPTASLDATNTRAVEQLVGAYRSAHDAGVIWITHDPEQAQRVGDRHFRIDGRLREVVS